MADVPGDPDTPGHPDAIALLESLRAGETTAGALVRKHLLRLEAQQPRLNAATQILHESALAEADAPRPGPLSGLPVSVKETCGIAGEQITAGSQRMPPIDCATDSAVVRRLREAGAIIIARGNVPELALAGETDNLRFGRTNNPLREDRTCGGSSGGEAALVGSGCTAIGIGSDILGSIRIPASFCGVVGFKPASNAVDKTGTWPELEGHLDSWLALGPLTRSVRDARLVYEIIAARPLPLPLPLGKLRLVTPEQMPLELRSACIGTALERARTALTSAGLSEQGHSFADVGDLYRMIAPLIAGLLGSELVSLLTTANDRRYSGLRETLRRWLGAPTVYDGLYRLLRVMPLVRPRRPERLVEMVARFEQAREHYRAVLGDDGLLLLPTLGMLAPRHKEMNRQTLRPGVHRGMTAVTLCNYLDLPAITVPAWSDRDPDTGLVPGVMLACAPGAEGALFAAAAKMEAAIATGAAH